MKYNVKALVQAAILLAICIVSQVFKNMSVYFTGSIINTCLIICVFTAGLGWAVILSVITPVTSFFITGSPIMAAIPLIIPCVMIGNIILVVCVKLLKDKPNRRVGTPLSMVAGSVLKALFMGGVIAMVIVPKFLPAPMEGQMKVIQTTFSVTQLITALIGSVFACIILVPLKKILK